MFRRFAREYEVVTIGQDLARGIHQVCDDKGSEVGPDLLGRTID
jgi:hypothetical protein